MTWNQFTHPLLLNIYDLPMNNDVIQQSIFDYDHNHVDNLQIQSQPVTTEP